MRRDDSVGGVSERVVDLNADVGEELDADGTLDAALLTVVTSANVACGFHAGTPETMQAVCGLAAAREVSIGAQVSYDDRAGFGRRRLDVPPEVLAQQVADQVGLLTRLAASEGANVRYLRPHGALYNRIADDVGQAAAVLAGSGDLPVLGLPGSVILELAAAAGRGVLTEAFPDRAYGPDGRLLPRSKPGAVLTTSTAIAARALELAGGVDSLCLHGDTPGAVAHVREVRRALETDGWVLRGL
jgi:5-oxoprolinase (ATP-hydrolysing) subunit A